VRLIRAFVAVALVALPLATCGGDDADAPARTAPAKSAAPAPGGPAALPPEFLECMAEQGYEVQSPTEIHAAPPQVLQACFESLHQGGGSR
jgi:hypothetical protein